MALTAAVSTIRTPHCAPCFSRMSPSSVSTLIHGAPDGGTRHNDLENLSSDRFRRHFAPC
jgi:hypothetical protein